MSVVKNTLRLVYYLSFLYTSVVSYGHLYSVRMRPTDASYGIIVRKGFFFHSTQRERERERKREKERERKRKREKERRERERERGEERKKERERKIKKNKEK